MEKNNLLRSCREFVRECQVCDVAYIRLFDLFLVLSCLIRFFHFCSCLGFDLLKIRECKSKGLDKIFPSSCLYSFGNSLIK